MGRNYLGNPGIDQRVILNYVTKFTEHIPSSVSNISAATQEIPGILCYQGLATFPYREPDQSSPDARILFLDD